jgi:predicted RNA binding protein YcfA (HicA-like mRNA interferase family)
MPKLGVFSGTEVCDILRAHGFELVRQRGSHVIMQRRLGETTVTVPVPNHHEIRIGTLQSIIRQSHLPGICFSVERITSQPRHLVLLPNLESSGSGVWESFEPLHLM